MKYRIYINMKLKKVEDTYEEAVKTLLNSNCDGRYMIIRHNSELKIDECIDIGNLPYEYVENKSSMELKEDILDLYDIKKKIKKL